MRIIKVQFRREFCALLPAYWGNLMRFATLKHYFLKSKTGKVIGGAYAIYLAVLMIGSAQIGLQSGTGITSVSEEK